MRNFTRAESIGDVEAGRGKRNIAQLGVEMGSQRHDERGEDSTRQARHKPQRQVDDFVL